MANFGVMNNETLVSEHMSVSLDDVGFSRGLTVFTTMEAREEIIFHFDDHIDRLRQSAVGAYVCTEEKFNKNVRNFLYSGRIKNLLLDNGFYESIVKIYLSSGVSADNFIPNGQFNLYVKVSDKRNINVKDSIRLSAMPHERLFPHIKNASDYFAAIMEMKRLESCGKRFDDILYLRPCNLFLEKNYFVLECSRANIFVLNSKNELITPPAHCVLPGVTRGIVLDLAKRYLDNGLKLIAERNIQFFSIINADIKEIFITSTTLGIKPVVMVNNKKFKVGKFTLALQKDFNEYREEYYREKKE